MTMAISSDVDMKLDMSLDDIVEQGRGVPAQGALLPTPTQPFGKSRHNKRSDRLAQSVPYRNRSSRAGGGGGGGGDSMMQGVNVHVSNLAFNVDWKNLKDYMRLAGNVVKASIMEDKGRSKGFGIVQFRTPEAAQHAIDKLNNTEFFGRTIYLRPDREEQRQYAASVDSDDGMHTPTYATGTRLYVGNLSWNVRWQDLKDHMKSAGTVKYADVMLEPSGRSKGCGLVEFSTPEEAQCAIDTLNDTELDGRRIFIREDREPDSGSISSIARPAGGNGRPPMRFQQSAHPHPHPPPPPPLPPQPPHTIDDTTALYVGNLAWNVKWQELKDLFRTVGEVDHAEVPIMPSGKSRGFGIVRYVYSDDAAEAINRLNGTEFLGRVIEVRYDRGRARP